MTSNSVADRFTHIYSRISSIAEEYDLSFDDITLIAVSKRQAESKIIDALNFGHRVFGENKVQEAYSKWPELKTRFDNIKLHLIGPLQTNKVKDAIQLFDVIHSVDRPKLAQKLAQEMDKLNLQRDCYIQVNTGEEEQKSGIYPEALSDFIDYCIHELSIPVVGLMCIPPVSEHPAPHFALLKKYADAHKLPLLSMGMSNDYDVAIAMGATSLRIGTELFGERDS